LSGFNKKNPHQSARISENPRPILRFCFQIRISKQLLIKGERKNLFAFFAAPKCNFEQLLIDLIY
jgi:hypothetical protein